MTTIASLRILLGLDSGGVKSGANTVNRDLKSVQAEANATNATLRNIGRGVQAGLGLGAGLGAFHLASKAVSTFTDFLGDSVRGAIEEEAGIRQLTQSLQANIPAWNGNTAAIEASIKVREDVGFADEELRSSLSTLVAATHDVNQAFEIQSTAMDLARFKNISLAEATNALIKVEAGSFRILKSLGIELRDGATQTEALAAVQKVAAGQAEEFGKTTAGAMTAANIAVDNLQEDIGTILAPVIRDLAVAIKDDVVPALRDMGAVIGSLQPVFDVIGGFLRIMTHDTDEFIAKVKEAKADIDANAFAVAAQAKAYADYNTALTTIQVSFAEGKITEDEYRKATEALDASFQELIVATDGFTHVAQETREHTLAAGAAFDRAHDASAAYAAALKTAEAASLTMATHTKKLTGDIGEADVRTGAFAVAARDAATALAAMDLKARNLAATLSGPLNRDLVGTADSMRNFSFETGGDLEGLKAHSDAVQAATAEQARRDAMAQAERDRRNAEATANAKRNAADLAAAYRDRLGDAFDAVRSSAHRFFDDLHERNLDAIRDIHDLANAALTEQQKAIRGAVDAEAARVEAIRTQRQEVTLRANVTAATDPEELARAQQSLNDFLDDQRIKFLGSQADTQIAALDAQKATNDQLAAAAVAAENDRSAAQVAAFDFDLATLQKKLSEHPKAWASTQQDILKVLMKYGVDFKAVAVSQGTQYAAGLLSTTRLAEDAAKALADAVANQLAVSPPPVVVPPPVVAPVPVPLILPPAPIVMPPPVPLIDVEAIRQATEMLDAQTIAMTAIGPAAVAGLMAARDAQVAFGASATAAAAETASAAASIRDSIASITAAALAPITLIFDVQAAQDSLDAMLASAPDVLGSVRPVTGSQTAAPASAAVAAGLAPTTINITNNNVFQVDGETLMQFVEKKQFDLAVIYNPTPVSTGSLR